MSTTSGLFSKRFLKAGGCYDGDDIVKGCALFHDECPEGQTFKGQADQCESNDMLIGRCLTEDTCAARASDCAEDTSAFNFENKDVSCTIQRDHTKPWDVDNPQFTQFGSCYNEQDNEYFCIFVPSDCDESGKEVYLTPNETLARNVSCDCSKVHVTGCVSIRSTSQCAMNGNGCDEGYEVRSPHFQRTDRTEGNNGLDCLLCSRVNTATPTPAPTISRSPSSSPTISALPTLTPTTTPTRMPSNFPANPETVDSPTASPVKDIASSGTDKGMIIGASIGGGLAVVLTALFINMMARRQRQNLRKKKKQEKSPPLPEISFIED